MTKAMDAAQHSGASAWRPLREPIFRALWIAAVASNIGTWMQNVGAAWLMTSLAPSPTMVALVQAATSLPVLLVAIPAGAFADIIDRRALLLATQAWMLAAAGLLGLLALVGATNAWALLALTFALGLGAALNAPAWQAIIPELVSRSELRAAVTLNGAGYNVARAVGPALGGLLVAAAGPAAVFILNALSFVGVIIVLFRWQRPVGESELPAENVLGAMRAGLRYARYAPGLQAVLARTAVFIIGGSALWALLPLVARQDLNLGATGYGVLLGCLGSGAVFGAVILPRLQQKLTTETLVALATLLFAAATAAPAYMRSSGPVGIALFGGGIGWITVMSIFNVGAQVTVPGWVRARALALYGLVFQGGTAFGSALWGMVAEHTGVSPALAWAAGALVIGLAAIIPYRLRVDEETNLAPALHWPEPVAVAPPAHNAGPVLVTIEYAIDPSRARDFVLAMEPVEALRRRDGAYRWGLFSDPSNPKRYVETFLVESWAEHMRQHERVTVADKEVENIARAFHVAETPPVVSHLIRAGDEPLPV